MLDGGSGTGAEDLVVSLGKTNQVNLAIRVSVQKYSYLNINVHFSQVGIPPTMEKEEYDNMTNQVIKQFDLT